MRIPIFSGDLESPHKLIKDVEGAMDPSSAHDSEKTVANIDLKKIPIRHLEKGEIPESVISKPEVRREGLKNPSLVPSIVFSYLNKLVLKHPELAGPINRLRYDIEDDSSVEEIMLKVKNAQSEGTLEEGEAKHILGAFKNRTEDENNLEKLDLKVGDSVNWKSEAVRWEFPKKVIKVSPEAVFVEGLPKIPILISQIEKYPPFDQEGIEKNIESKEMELHKGVESRSEVSPLGVVYPDFEMIEKPQFQIEAGESRNEIIKLDSAQIDTIKNEIKDLESEREEYFNNNKDVSSADRHWYESRISGLRKLLESESDVAKYKKEELPYIDADFEMVNEVKNRGRQIEGGQSPEVDDTFVGPMPEEPFTGPMPEVFMGPVPTQEEMGKVNVEVNLGNTREDYAKLLVEHKNKVREKKNLFHKLMGDLGIENDKQKKLAELEKSADFIAAEKAYIQAKKAKAQDLFAKSRPEEVKSNFGVGLEKFNFNPELVDQAEKEYGVLQKKIMENVPPLEKGRMGRAFEKWAKWPLPARIALSSAILTTAGIAFGNIGVAGAASYAGYRVARGLTGALASQAVGGAVGKMQKRNIESDREKNKEEYGKEISETNYEEKEKELMNYFEGEQNKKKRQMLYKAAAMAATGVGTSIGLGMAQGAYAPEIKQDLGIAKNIKHALGIKEDDIPLKTTNDFKNISGEKGLMEKMQDRFKSRLFAEEPGTKNAVAPNISAPETPPVKVELSSRGFIQTFDDLKDKLKAQYPDESKMPAGVKTFLDKSSVKLAQDYGFYDAEKGASGMGLKGENLVVDSKGNLSLEHLKGKPSEIINTTDHKFNNVGGRMFVAENLKAPKVEVPSSYSGTLETDMNSGEFGDFKPTVPSSEIVEPSSDLLTPNANISSIPSPLDVKGLSPHAFEMPFGDKTFHVDVANIAGHKEVLVDGVKVAEQTALPGGGEVVKLLDKYQEGKVYSGIRQAFTQARVENDIFEKMKLPKEAVVTGVAFENGRVDVIRGMGENKDAVNVFLNGKEIAKGLIDKKGAHVSLLKGIPKGGWLFGDTTYDKAFNQAKSIIKGFKK